MAIPEPAQHQKVCFITIGATAGFDALIRASLSAPFLRALQSANYTHLTLQHGTSGAEIFSGFTASNAINSAGRYGLSITGFAFKKHGLGAEMRAAKGSGDSNTEGLVISHAGALSPLKPFGYFSYSAIAYMCPKVLGLSSLHCASPYPSSWCQILIYCIITRWSWQISSPNKDT